MLHEKVCASCSSAFPLRSCIEVSVDDINIDLLKWPDHWIEGGRVVDDMWLHGHHVPPFFPHFDDCLQDILVILASLISCEGKPQAMQFCLSYYRLLKNRNMSNLAIANHLYVGDVPEELRGLTIVEEALIAQCHAKSCIIHLKENMDSFVPNAQCAMRGHIIVFPQQPKYVIDLLPPSLDEISSYVCVVFMGSHPPTLEWLC